jgi:penicillin-binding protein 2
MMKSQIYIQSVGMDWYRKRIQWIMGIIFFSFAMLSVRLFYLQILEGDYYAKMSENNCIRIQRMNAFRGLIYDRNEELLVENRPSFDVTIIPKDANPLPKTAQTLSQYIEIPCDDIMKTVQKKGGNSGFQPVVVKQDISRDALAVISAHRYYLPGVFIECNSRRNYIHEKLACHLIGYLGEINAEELASGKFLFKQRGDYIGRYGVEKEYEEFLSGKPGGRIIQVNANGQMIKVLDTVAPEAAHNIFLTIDIQLQQKAEALLQGKTGAVVAMDPLSGEILAMASSPSFDQNLFVDGISHQEWKSLISNPDRPLTNKAISGEYPPGSTFKIVTAMAGLEEKLVDDTTKVFCPGGYRFGNRVYGCWKEQGHGTIDIFNAFAESCDVYFYQLGRRLGVDRLAEYAKKSGLGSATGIDLANESSGLVPTSEWKKKRFGVPWQAGENLSIAIGQGYDLVTPMQMLTLISAIANGGMILKPKILKSLDSKEDNPVKPDIRGLLPASSKTLHIIQKGLWEVVNKEYGTARTYVRSDEIDISGKTGTSQVISRKIDDKTHKAIGASSITAHAWFVGYAPSDSPRISVAVIVEHGGHGSSAAGPIAKDIMLSYLKKDF